MSEVRSALLSWRQVEAAIKRGAAAIFPMGSTEEHGPHAAMGDFLIAEEIGIRAAQITQDIVFPSLPFSYSEYFRHFPGTITLQDDTLFRVVEDTVNCLIDSGFKHIVLLNGHKGNDPTLMHLIRKIRRERGKLVPIVSPLAFGLTPEVQKELYGDNKIGHGAEPMASLWTYLFPGTVDLERIEDWGTGPFLGLPIAGLSGVKFEGADVGFAIDMENVTPPSGSLADPRMASAARGERIVENAVGRLARFLEWFRTTDPDVEKG